MLKTDVQSWLEIIRNVGQECGWDKSLVFAMETDERTFIVQVRKSGLTFNAVEEPGEPRRYTVSYTMFPYNSTPDATARRFTAGKSRAPTFVAEELETWLRQSVAKYVTDNGVPD
jgi:hypothetical protein